MYSYSLSAFGGHSHGALEKGHQMVTALSRQHPEQWLTAETTTLGGLRQEDIWESESCLANIVSG